MIENKNYNKNRFSFLHTNRDEESTNEQHKLSKVSRTFVCCRTISFDIFIISYSFVTPEASYFVSFPTQPFHLAFHSFIIFQETFVFLLSWKSQNSTNTICLLWLFSPHNLCKFCFLTASHQIPIYIWVEQLEIHSEWCFFYAEISVCSKFMLSRVNKMKRSHLHCFLVDWVEKTRTFSLLLTRT